MNFASCRDVACFVSTEKRFEVTNFNYKLEANS